MFQKKHSKSRSQNFGILIHVPEVQSSSRSPLQRGHLNQMECKDRGCDSYDIMMHSVESNMKIHLLERLRECQNM